MSSPDLKRELIDLLNLQISALEKEVFGVVTESELREYQRRQERISELYNLLTRRQAVAA